MRSNTFGAAPKGVRKQRAKRINTKPICNPANHRILRAKGDEVLLPLLEEVLIPNILQRIAKPLTKSIPSVSFVDYIREQDKLCYRLTINESIGQTILKSTSDANDKFTVRSNFIDTPEKEMNIHEFLSWANSANLEPAFRLITVVDLLNRSYK